MPAPSLRELQENFVGAALSGGELGFPVKGGGTLSAIQALAVYQDGYRARLSEAMGETYEGVWSVLGDEGFFSVCRGFIAGHPSAIYNLSDYGLNFGLFLASHPESRRWPFLPELAAFEWRFKELFHLKEHLPIVPAALGVAAGNSRLVLGAEVCLRRHANAVYEIWRTRKDRAASCRQDWNQPEQLLMYKREGDIFVHPLNEPEFLILETLSGGRTLEESIGEATRIHPGLDQERIARLFMTISESGIVERID